MSGVSGGTTAPVPEERAWGWLAHLRDGGTTPWARWAASAGGSPPAATLPGGAQLELLRRVNELARPAPATTERVLGATATGRGFPERALPGLAAVGPDAGGFGAPAVDPAALPAEELLRVAAAALAGELAARPLPEAPVAPLPRPWHPAYRLVGDPWLTRSLRTELLRRGRPPGGRRPLHLVLGTGVATMLTHAWASLVLRGSVPAWPTWVGARAGREDLPPRADLVPAARRAAGLVGPDRVRIVLDLSSVGGLLRVKRLPPPARPPSADAWELARRVGQALGAAEPETRRRRLALLLPRLDAVPGPDLGVPEPLLGWVGECAERMAAELAGDGYAARGDLRALAGAGGSDPGASGGVPSAEGALDAAVRLLAEGAVGDAAAVPVPGAGGVDEEAG